ncbi:MAG: MFS transporter [Marinobacter sp.]|nr:MFS transporter [Marinobacter sp.]
MNEGLPLRTYLFFVAQSINLTTAVMSVAMAALVGATLADEPAWATLPYGFQFLAVMLVTYPASWFMSRFGRKAGFMLGNLFLALAGVLGFVSIQQDAFGLLVVTHAALGAYIAFANFNRFAAADGLSEVLKPKAISLVVAGGVLAAFLGPFISENLRAVDGYQNFALSYGAFVMLALVSMVIAWFIPDLRKDRDRNPVPEPQGGATLLMLLKDRQVMLAIVVSSLGYGVMNLLMVQASLHMESMHTAFSDVNLAIQWHVAAMFAPSFFTGKLIRLWGKPAVLYLGIALLMVTSVTNLMQQDYLATAAGLVLLGVGWNFTYVGGGALLTEKLGTHPLAMKVQGINDVSISVMATLGAFLPSLLLASLGWTGTNAICLMLCAMVLAAAFYLLSTARQGQLVSEVPRP